MRAPQRATLQFFLFRSRLGLICLRTLCFVAVFVLQLSLFDVVTCGVHVSFACGRQLLFFRSRLVFTCVFLTCFFAVFDLQLSCFDVAMCAGWMFDLQLSFFDVGICADAFLLCCFVMLLVNFLGPSWGAADQCQMQNV